MYVILKRIGCQRVELERVKTEIQALKKIEELNAPLTPFEKSFTYHTYEKVINTYFEEGGLYKREIEERQRADGSVVRYFGHYQRIDEKN